MRQLSLVLVIAATAIAGTIVAGCASRIQTIIINDEAGTTEGGASSGKTSSGTSGTSGTSGSTSGSTSSSSSSSSSSGASGTSGGACPDPTPIDQTQLPWKPPAKSIGACTTAELNALVTYVNANASATYAQWKSAGVNNPTCRACIFGLETATTWAPLVEDAAGQLVGLNVGGCIAIASGNVNCGKAYQNWFDCRFEACAGCPSGDTAALQKCLGDASKTGAACNNAFNAVDTVCTAQTITDAETACTGTSFVFEGPVKAQCIGGVP